LAYVLNAFRHPREEHERKSLVNTLYALCSTPSGIRGRNTTPTRSAHSLP